METSPDTGTLLNNWVAGLNAAEVVEARECLMAGTYSRRLLISLRAALPNDAAARHGLDDPHLVRAGAPLSATVQTVLRTRFLKTSPGLRGTWQRSAPVTPDPSPHDDLHGASLFEHLWE